MSAPTPWRRNGKCIEDDKHGYCCHTVDGQPDILDHITLCVNTHDALVEALEEALDNMVDAAQWFAAAFNCTDNQSAPIHNRIAKARAALALAKGETHA